MKTIANRLIVIAASALAFGSMAFGQVRMTAEIPFAFHAVGGMLPAGTYEVRDISMGAASHVVLMRNVVTGKTSFAGNPRYDDYVRASKPSIEFSCVERACSLKAIKTAAASFEYVVPMMRDDSKKMAVVSLPLKPLNAD